MSGFEVIGVILALIPLVSGGIDSYKRVRDGQESRQLERDFKTQKVIFLNTIEELIYPLVPDSQLPTLLKDPNGRIWQDKRLSASLEKHLDGAYPTFNEIMEDIKVVMCKLQDSLSPEVSVSWSSREWGDKTDILVQSLESRKVHRQIKLFLTRSRSEAGLERLKAKIADLEILKGQSQRLAPHRRVKSVKMESFGGCERARSVSMTHSLVAGLANARILILPIFGLKRADMLHLRVMKVLEEKRRKFVSNSCSPFVPRRPTRIRVPAR